eukprot:jgi/Picre1/31698/NNA_007049.t1
MMTVIHSKTQLQITSRPVRRRSGTRRQPETVRSMFGLNIGKKTVEKRLEKKQELLTSLQGLGRGLKASDEDKERINLSAKWKLEYTTSDSILGTKRPPFLRPFGDIFQTIRAEKLEARNQETWPFFNAVEATLEPVNSSKVNVKFDTFYIGSIIPIKAPDSARGELTVTYLDDTLRISRGNRGNLFILSR